MPLVFAVLVVVVWFMYMNDSKKRETQANAGYTKSIRKTNARLEQKTLDGLMKEGHSFEEAYRLTQEEMVRMGFEPCIPRSAYKPRHNMHGGAKSVQTSRCPRLEEYDSFEVQQRWSKYTTMWSIYHPNEPPPKITDELIYKDFPTDIYTYRQQAKTEGYWKQAVPIGEYLIYPGLGTCEVIQHIVITPRWGKYKVKVLSTGEINEDININDPKITRVI